MTDRMGGPLPDGHGEAVVSVRNVGGIDECELSIRPGATILAGRNATNRTSLLSALAGVLGGSVQNLKSDADRGRVELALDGESFVREYERTADGVVTSGDAYAGAEGLVDLFVALFRDNPVRRAVEAGGDLHEIITRPVDTDVIEERIAALREEIDGIEETIGRVEDRRAELPALERRRAALAEELDEVDAELRTLREEAAEREAELEATGHVHDLVEELEETREQLTEVEQSIEVTEAELEALREELRELRTERGDLPDARPDELDELTRELRRARERKSELGDAVTSLTSIVELNRDLVEDGEALPGIEPDDGDVTAALAPDEDRAVRCWTCGSRVDRGTIEDRLDDLVAVVEEKRRAFKRTSERIESLVERRDDLERAVQRREELDRRIDSGEDRIAEREATLAEKREEAAALRDRISELESDVAAREDLDGSDLLEGYERIADLEYERGQLDERRADIDARIDEIESLPDPDALREQREELRDALATERDRIETLETNAVEAFNTHMDELLDVLAFDNVARVWIERRRAPGDDGRGSTTFDLHVVRRSREDAGYEDAVDHLSESEREVIGLVVGLAGYLVHEVHETVPFILLDSLEAIDADRIGALVDYFARYAPYLVVALLPEDAAALDERHERITADRIGS